ncbi:luciferase domain-containing protein [Actinomadura litoris]|uniref:Luciferase domain-containing protein n=1 Tax=Actinomadura litoris TaxID=2678616 RepID=A0A7K1L3W8_9ACTN|nr:luciferase family protein [Actinomadura litoris]MUN39097.1 hypothetical protein [Actinomadura litoris]
MRRGRSPRSVCYADLALGRFRDWPLTACRADCPPGRALAVHGRQIVHLHQGNMAEVLLTESVARRMTDALTATDRVIIPPDSGWVQVHLDTDNDLFLLQSLVSLAIQANESARGPYRHGVRDCPHVRPAVRGRRILARDGVPPARRGEPAPLDLPWTLDAQPHP